MHLFSFGLIRGGMRRRAWPRWGGALRLDVWPAPRGAWAGFIHVSEVEYSRTGAEVHVGLEPGLRIRMLGP